MSETQFSSLNKILADYNKSGDSPSISHPVNSMDGQVGLAQPTQSPMGFMDHVSDVGNSIVQGGKDLVRGGSDMVRSTVGGFADLGNKAGLVSDETKNSIDESNVKAIGENLKEAEAPDRYKPKGLSGEVALGLTHAAPAIAVSMIPGVGQVLGPAAFAIQGAGAGFDAIAQGDSLNNAQAKAIGQGALNTALGHVVSGSGNALLSKVPVVGRAFEQTAADTLPAVGARFAQGAGSMAAFKPAGAAIDAAADYATGEMKNPDGTDKTYDWKPGAADLLIGGFMAVPHSVSEYASRNKMPAQATLFSDGSTGVAHKNGTLFSSSSAAESFIQSNKLDGATVAPVTKGMFDKNSKDDKVLGYVVKPPIDITPSGGQTSEAIPPTDPVTQSLTDSANKGGPLSTAVLAADPIGQRASEVEVMLRSGDLLEKVRAIDPSGATPFLDAWRTAQNKSLPEQVRQTALNQVNQVMDLVKQRQAKDLAQQVGSQMPNLEQQGPGVEINNGLPSSITQAGHQWSEMSGSTPAEDMAAQKAQALQEQQAQETQPSSDAPIIQSGPRERQAKRDAELAGQRWQDKQPIGNPAYESSPYPAPSTEGVSTSGDLNGTKDGAQPVPGVSTPTGRAIDAGSVAPGDVGRDGLAANQERPPVSSVGELGKQSSGSSNSTVGEGHGNEATQAIQAETQGSPEPSRTAVEPEAQTVTPAGDGPADVRRRKAQLSSMISKGFSDAERRDDGSFWLINHRTNEEMKLDGPADFQRARTLTENAIKEKAAESPSSPRNEKNEPSKAQIDANNYEQPETEKLGFRVGVEQDVGSERKGIDEQGKSWRQVMRHIYGKIKGFGKGFDGDEPDAFVGHGRRIFVIDQTKPDGTFDEHKIMLGFKDEEDARQSYLSNYEKGWNRIGAITEMRPHELRQWLKNGGALKPAKPYDPVTNTGVKYAAVHGVDKSSSEGKTDGQDRAGDQGVDRTGGQPEDIGLRDSSIGSLAQSGSALRDSEKDAADVASTAQKQGREISLANPEHPATRAINALLDVMAGLTGHRGIAVSDTGRGASDGFYDPLTDRYHVNVDAPQMNVAKTIVHEFGHLAKKYPGIAALYSEMYRLIPENIKREYFEKYKFKGQSFDSANGKQLHLLEEEMINDFLGGRMHDKEWLADLANKKPNLFQNFIKEWIPLLDKLITELRGILGSERDSGLQQKDIDERMISGGHLDQLEQMKRIAMDVAEEWAKNRPAYAERAGINDILVKHSSREDLQKEMEDELNGRSVSDEDIKAKGRMAEDAYPDLEWKPDSSGFQETTMAPSEGKHQQRIEMNEDLRSDLWEGGMNNTWVGPSLDERDGYATKKGARDFFRRQVAAIDLRNRKFDLANTVEKSKLNELVSAWKTMEEIDGAHRYRGTLRSDMSLKDIAKSMGVTDKYDVSIMKAPSELGEHSISVTFVDKKTGASYGATLDRHTKDGQRFLTANTIELGKSGLGGAFYQMAAEFAARNGMKLHPEDSLSGINAYRRTEQQLSAALRTDKSNVMVPHKVQRVHGFEDDATRQEQHDANLGRLILAGVRNAKELIPSFEALRYSPEMGTFTDTKGVDREKAITQILNSPDSRAFGMGRSTLARAVMSNMILKGELSAKDVASFKEPVLYSARDEAAQQYRDVEDEYRGTEHWMKAPNGKPTKLNERQWVQARTPNFLKWFGDWTKGDIWGRDDVSKVVDENGEPLVVYHGTDKGGFYSFNEPGGKDRGDLGIFTTSNGSMAESYIRKGHAKDLTPLNDQQKLDDAGIEIYEYQGRESSKATKDETFYGYRSSWSGDESGYSSKEEAQSAAISLIEEGDDGSTKPGVYATFLNLRNPYETNFEGAMWSGERHDQFMVLDKDGEPIYTDDGRQFMDNAEAIDLADARGGQVTDADSHWETTDSAVRNGRNGHDGTIILNVVDDGGGVGYDMEPSDVFVANHADQLKSADFNTGEFGDTDDIRYSEKSNEREYKLDIKMEERSTLKTARLSEEEQSAIASAAKDLGLSDVAVAKVIESAKETKKRFPVSKGWAPAEVIGIYFKKDDDELPIPGTEEPKFKVIPYGFNIPPGEKRAPAKIDEKWMSQVTDKFHGLVEDLYKRSDAGDKNAQTIIAHQTWYRNVAEVLRREYGAQGDLLADLLGAISPNTPVDTNWRFSLDILRRFVRGEFKPLMENFVKYIEAGGAPSKYPAAEKIRQLSGKLYGMNSGNAMVAMANLWRNIESGQAPKARNFALNLIGQSNMATIDVWAARMLRRAANLVRGADLPRIPPSSEAGVSGVWNADATKVTGAFGFGAEVMRRVSERMQKDGRNVTPPDLQAIAWFAEKELWGTKGWTTKTGEGGSFEENISASPVERYLAGWSIQQGEKAPEPGDVSTAQARVMAMLIGDDSVVAARAQPTFGLYGGVIEHSFDTEWTVTKGQHDPSLVMAEIAKVSKENGQYDIFVSRVIHPDERSANARPGVEIYFKTKRDLEAAMPVLNEFTSRGQDGFTLATDMRSKPGEFIGVRLQYVPEISMRWDEGLRKELMAPGGIEKVLKEKFEALRDIARDVQLMNGVAYASTHLYDTVVIGKENYDEYIDRAAGGGHPKDGGQVWFGRPVREGLEGAVARYEGKRGQVDAGRVPDAGSELQSVKNSSRDEGHSGRDGAPDQRTIRSAIHYGQRPGLKVLSGSSHGTGLKGAEYDRLKNTTDPRLTKRVYFYAPVEGGIPQPEIGLGGSVYRADLEGIYDLRTANQPIRGAGNSFESALLDAGYKGYINPEQGTIVVLNQDVPVEHIGGIGDHKVIQRRNERTIPRVETRQEGAELVRQPQGQEAMDLVQNKAAIKDAAPSYRMEYGHARVLKSEAPKADAVLAKAGSTFQFGDIRHSSRDLGFYSELSKQVEKATMKQAPSGAWKSYIKALTQKGVKADEIEWTGVNDFLDLKDGKVSKDEILKFLDGNGVQINEVTLGSPKADVEKVSAKIGHLGYEAYLDPIDGTAYFIDPDGEIAYYDDLPDHIQKMVDDTGVSVSGPAKYENYVLPGGENYREVLLTLPGRNGWLGENGETGEGKIFNTRDEAIAFAGLNGEVSESESKDGYRSSHWDQKNVLAHIRMNDRTDSEGKRVLFVEEVQSDWGQDGKKKGFNAELDKTPLTLEEISELNDLYGLRITGRTPEQTARMHALNDRDNASKGKGTIPAAPFVGKTDAWVSLALKRVIKMAVDGGYDKVAFVNGEQSADRYSLAKKVKIIDYSVTGDQNYHVEAFTHDGEVLPIPYSLDADGIERYVGKEIAQKIVDTATREKQSVKGDDLKVGGEGMKTFYDRIVPSVAKDVLKKLGGEKLETVSMSHDPNQELSKWEPEDGVGDGSKAAIDQYSQPGFTITPEMRDKVGSGMPLFSERDEKNTDLFHKDVNTQRMYLHSVATKEYLLNRRVSSADTEVSERSGSPNSGDVASVINSLLNDKGDDEVKKSMRSGTSTWDMYDDSKFDDITYKLQNKQIDTKRVIESIEKYVGKVDNDKNVYLQEELFHGRAAKATHDFAKHELEPLMKEIKDAGYELSDVEEYLHARHAKEANAVIAMRDPSMPDGGSGMTDAAADAYMRALSQEDRAKLSSISAKVDAITNQTRQMYADYGLESQATVDGWKSMFKNYIPLQREDKEGTMGIGQGFSVKGKEVKGRTGSTRKVVDILANIAMQRERLIVRGEKNRVSNALLGLAIANPNPEFWSVGAPPSERVYDPDTNSVVLRPDPMYKSRDNVIVTKAKQPDGTIKEVAVVFNEEDKRALRMAKALKNLDAGDLEGLLGVSAKITRYFSAVNTQYNPVFGVVNLVRDVQHAMITLDRTPLAKKKGKIARDTVSALSGIYQDMRAERNGQPGTSQWSQLWEDFQHEGGQTGYRQMFATSKDRAEELQKTLNPDAWLEGKYSKIFTANGALKVPLSKAKEGASVIFDWLSDYNESMENGVRLATYKAGLDQGMSKQEAASLAKNLTVNFNRKGQIGQQAGAVYAFFNAAVQGTANIGQTLFTMEGGNIKSARLSSTGKKVVYGGMMLGAMQALALAAAGFTDDDPPQFVRDRGLVFPIGDKKYISIPLPQGFNVIPGMGRQLTEFALNGFKNPAKKAIDLIGLFADNFNPIGNAGMSMQTLAPTALDPLVALTENRDFTGKPIARVNSNKAVPGFTQFKDSATVIGKLIAEGINGVTGGNAYVAGALSPTPDQIDYLLGQVTGGVGRELSKVEQTAISTATGEDVPSFKMPLVGRFYGDAKEQAAQGGQFYSNVNHLNEIETEVKAMRKDGKSADAQQVLRDNPDAYLIAQANVAERQVQRLNKEKRDLVAKGADRDLVKAKELQITAVMTRLNNAMEKIHETSR
jgi:hypothetical protein